jgi:hypothetical protein
MKSKSHRKARSTAGIPLIKAEGLSYRGPLNFTDKNANAGIKVRLSYVTQANCAAGSGTLSIVIPDDPSLSSEWSDYTPHWNSYRVLGMKTSWQPFQVNWQNLAATNTVSQPVCFKQIRDGGIVAPLTYIGAWAGAAPQIKNSSQQHNMTTRADGVNDMVWQPIGTPIPTWAHCVTGQNFVLGQGVFLAFVEFFVEFRNRD